MKENPLPMQMSDIRRPRCGFIFVRELPIIKTMSTYGFEVRYA